MSIGFAKKVTYFYFFHIMIVYRYKKGVRYVINVCASGFSKTLGLSALAFCTGMICGLFFPIAVVAVIETLLLITFGYLCLFKW